jgi:hypothetical protein
LQKQPGKEKEMPMREVHLRRWQVVFAFVSVTAAFVIGLILIEKTVRKANRLSDQNALLIARLEKTSVTVTELNKTTHDLDRTICGVRQFLLTAQETRANDAKHDQGEKRIADLEAVKRYSQLLNYFPQNCRSFQALGQ